MRRVCCLFVVLLKDYLRELPDPLCTSALYQMLMDALSVQVPACGQWAWPGVQVPGDSLGNAQLMLSILDCLPRINQVRHSSLLPAVSVTMTTQ